MKTNGLIMLMALVSLNVLGQRNRNLLPDEEQLAKMKTELSLTEDQVTRLQMINETFQEEGVLLNADTTMSAGQVAAENTRILRERNAGIRTVLTKDQFSRWMAIKKEQSTQRGGARAASQDNLQQMKTALGLSDEQLKSIMAINAKMSGEFRKLRADTVISREDRTGELKKIMANRNAKIKKVLTEEQYVKFLEYEDGASGNRRRGPRVSGKK